MADTFSPPRAVQRAAARGLELREEFGRGGTATGVARARDLSNGKGVSLETINRMVSFFARHESNKDTPPEEGNGQIAWLLWGGNPGRTWANRIANRADKTEEKAYDDKQKSYGKDDKPGNDRRGSDRNESGSASSSSNRIEISESTETALRNKVEDHNAKDNIEGRASLGQLKAVYRRGAGAFSTGARAGMSRNQWAMARVNAYLRLLRTGTPENSKYTQDNDLLPSSHPRATKRDMEKKLFGEVAKVDDKLGLVFGYAIVSKVNGEEYFDVQGDHIPEDAMLKAAADFMQNSRVAKEMHTGGEAGTVVFAMPITDDIADSLGIIVEKTGLIIAMKPVSDEMLEKFRDGTYTGFSIGGMRGEDEVVED